MRNIHLIKCKGSNRVVTYDSDYQVWEDTPRVIKATQFKDETSAKKHLGRIARDLCIKTRDLEIVQALER